MKTTAAWPPWIHRPAWANRRAVIAARPRCRRAIRTHEPMALMMVDIDHFKNVNDCHGHPVGDKVLCSVVGAARAGAVTRLWWGATAARNSWCCCPTPRPEAATRWHSACESLAGTALEHEGQPIPVTVSIGVYGGRLQPGDHWDMLISAADRALYEARTGAQPRGSGGGVAPPRIAGHRQLGPRNPASAFLRTGRNRGWSPRQPSHLAGVPQRAVGIAPAPWRPGPACVGMAFCNAHRQEPAMNARVPHRP